MRVVYCYLLATFLGSRVLAAEAPSDFSSLVEQASRAVVNISTTQKITQDKKQGVLPDLNDLSPELRDFFNRFFDRPPPAGESRTRGLGSGLILSSDGYILTAAHVVKDADEVVVHASDRHEWAAKIVGVDTLIDVALLKIETTGLQAARIGNADTLKVGQWVLAIGQPFGLDYTATAGIVSALGRNLPNDTYVPFIQTDVAVNPGNSGGPLYNMEAAVVGINSQIYTPSGGYAGLSFAIPIGVAVEAAEQIKTRGRVIRGWLGVSIQPVTQDLASSFGLDRPKGALVAQVANPSPARAAGFQPGDVVITYRGHPVESASDLPPLVGRTSPGEKVPVTLFREGREQVLMVTVAELPGENTRQAKPKKTKAREAPLLGLSVTDLPVGDRPRKGSPNTNGVMIKRVEEGPGRAAGLRQHDVILRIGTTMIRDVEHFRSLTNSLSKGHTFPMLVLREGNPLFLALHIPE